MLLFIQIIQIIYSIIINFIKEKKDMLVNTAICSLISIFLYIYLGEINAIFASTIIFIRNIVYVNKVKYKSNLPFFFCICMHLIGGIYALYLDKNLIVINFIPMITSLMACFFYWFSSEQAIRIGSLCTNTLWLIFNIYYGLYLTSLICFIGIITPLMAYLLYKKKGQKFNLIKTAF